MNIPNIKSIMLPFLQYIDDSQEHHRKDIADALAVEPFELTPEQKAELMPKGMPVFGYRCDWAKTFLKKAGLVEAPKQGYSRITDHGLAFLEAWDNNPEEIEDVIMKSPAKFYDYVNNRWPTEGKNDNDQISEESIEDEDDDQTLAGMDFIEEIRNLSIKIEKQKDVIRSEEATKNACVMPFIKLLGYDVSDLTEVVPEFTADFGTKQGEKVDYAVFRDGEVIMIIECKKFGTDLSDDHAAQLYRYFSVTHPPVAVLTDGALYRFYTDLEKSNVMDMKPFLEFNLLDIQYPLVNELERFTKPDFNLDAIRIAAGDLKYTKKIKQTLVAQLEAPTEEFVQFFLSSVYTGEGTPAKIQQFTGFVKRALKQFLDEQMNQHLQSTINGEEDTEESLEVEKSKEKKIDPAKQPTQEDDREPENKHPQKTHINKNAETRLHITMSDQTEISHDQASDTFCEVLKRLGFEDVHEIEPGVVSKIPFPNGKHKQVDGYWINVNNGTTPKKRILDRIARKLGFSGAWNVKVIPK